MSKIEQSEDKNNQYYRGRLIVIGSHMINEENLRGGHLNANTYPCPNG